MERKPIQAGPEEGGRVQLGEGPTPTSERVTPPPAASARDAELDARIRLKQDAGEPLDADERAYLARLPGDREVRYDD